MYLSQFAYLLMYLILVIITILIVIIIFDVDFNEAHRLIWARTCTMHFINSIFFSKILST